MGRQKVGGLQIGIIVLTISTAVIHLLRNFPNAAFILNCLGYLGLLAALYLPVPFFASRRGMVRILLMGYTVLTIIAWIGVGDKSLATGYVGYIAKVIEIVLIILLWLEHQRSKIGR